MDLKTLEYLESRAKQGRKIADRIDELRGKKEKLLIIRKVAFLDNYNDRIFNLDPSYQGENDHHKRIIDEIKAALKNAIENEIARLEQELAEL